MEEKRQLPIRRNKNNERKYINGNKGNTRSKINQRKGQNNEIKMKKTRR